jgi:hypothetical protein
LALLGGTGAKDNKTAREAEGRDDFGRQKLRNVLGIQAKSQGRFLWMAFGTDDVNSEMNNFGFLSEGKTQVVTGGLLSGEDCRVGETTQSGRGLNLRRASSETRESSAASFSSCQTKAVACTAGIGKVIDGIPDSNKDRLGRSVASGKQKSFRRQ